MLLSSCVTLCSIEVVECWEGGRKWQTVGDKWKSIFFFKQWMVSLTKESGMKFEFRVWRMTVWPNNGLSIEQCACRYFGREWGGRKVTVSQGNNRNDTLQECGGGGSVECLVKAWTPIFQQMKSSTFPGASFQTWESLCRALEYCLLSIETYFPCWRQYLTSCENYIL